MADKADRWVWLDVDDVLVGTSVEIEKSLRRITGIDLPVECWTSHMFSEAYRLGAGRRAETRCGKLG